LISVITGPSRTADIEKTLVMGAHGPRELFVFLIEDSI
ncbi:MAG: LUD domain-containing protein, partial [Bacteroidales bacterium]